MISCREVRNLLTDKKFLNFGDHPVDGSIAELRVNRQREDLPGHTLAGAQTRRPHRNAVAIGGMQMHRHRIMNAGADRRGAQMLAQAIAARAADYVLVKDVAGTGPARRQRNRQPGETIVVARGNRLAPLVVAFEPRQLDREDCRLDRVEPRVDARAGADVTLAPAIFANFPSRFGERGISRGDDSGIAERAQIFGRIKAEAGDVAETPDGASAVMGAVTLRAILDDPQTVPPGEFADYREISRLAVEMN